MKDALKDYIIVGPFIAIMTCSLGWIYQVENGLQPINDDQSCGVPNQEGLFEPYLIEKRVQEEMKKGKVYADPKPTKEDAEIWTTGKINHRIENK